MAGRGATPGQLGSSRAELTGNERFSKLGFFTIRPQPLPTDPSRFIAQYVARVNFGERGIFRELSFAGGILKYSIRGLWRVIRLNRVWGIFSIESRGTAPRWTVAKFHNLRPAGRRGAG